MRGWPDGKGPNTCFQIVWVIEGNGNYSIDMETFSLAGNTLFFIPPALMQCIRSLKEIAGWVFNSDFLQPSEASAWMHSFTDMAARFSRVAVIELIETPAAGMLKMY